MKFLFNTILLGVFFFFHNYWFGVDCEITNLDYFETCLALVKPVASGCIEYTVFLLNKKRSICGSAISEIAS